jgi:hypothetical protein
LFIGNVFRVATLLELQERYQAIINYIIGLKEALATQDAKVFGLYFFAVWFSMLFVRQLRIEATPQAPPNAPATTTQTTSGSQ